MLMDHIRGLHVVACGTAAQRRVAARLVNSPEADSVGVLRVQDLEVDAGAKDGPGQSCPRYHRHHQTVLLHCSAADLDAMPGYPPREVLGPYHHMALCKDTTQEDFVACMAMLFDPGVDVDPDLFERACVRSLCAVASWLDPEDVGVVDTRLWSMGGASADDPLNSGGS